MATQNEELVQKLRDIATLLENESRNIEIFSVNDPGSITFLADLSFSVLDASGRLYGEKESMPAYDEKKTYDKVDKSMSEHIKLVFVIGNQEVQEIQEFQGEQMDNNYNPFYHVGN